MSRPAKTAVKDTPTALPTAAPAAARAPALTLLWPLVLAALALAETALSVYQWSELLVLRAGGQTSCGINASINCETVWNSAFASRVHELTGVPVAGLGVAWGLTALVVAAALAFQAWKGERVAAQVGAVRLVAAAGFLSTITFAVASARTGALCPTCLGTYALVLGFLVVALWKLPGAALSFGQELGRSIAWAVVPAVLAFLAVLGPGRSTPRADAQGLKALGRAAASTQVAPQAAPAQPSRPLTEREQQVASFIASLSPMERQSLSDSLASYRHAPMGATAGYPARKVVGDANAPLKMVEWTDILCPHCAQLSDTVKELKRVLPPGLMSIESRQFPLTSVCNSVIPPSPRDVEGGQVRCVSAKAVICLEQAPGYAEAHEKIFAEQRSLTPARVLEIASGAGMDRAALEACVAAPATQEKLDQDIRYGMANRLQGTPLVLLNGRQSPPYGPLIYALAVLGGDAESPAFASLPPPRALGDHDGHGH
ncbi:MAG: DsbA family protein [Myxococcaceae bacterium]|nr:DsbA family protein [Myxococcaceae bacterium]MCI0673380.1 DsbA family protein [Myxococcaceae bacterium]